MIRVFVVDDSSFSRKLLRRVIESTSDICIVGEADTGSEALVALSGQEVDVITLDVNLPDMSGLDVLRQVRARWPRTAVLMLSALTREGAGTTVEALTLGAADFIDKTKFGSFDVLQLGEHVLQKLRGIARRSRTLMPVEMASPSRRPGSNLPDLLAAADLCVVGASTGGPLAVQRLLQSMQGAPPFPIAIAQHMPAGFTREFAHRLAGVCAYPVREATPRERLERGVAYIAPGGHHMVIDHAWTVQIRRATEENAPSPSVDELFLSVSELQVRVCAVILTGMGRDGARGLAAVRTSGGLTLGQDADSSVVYGMPRAAAEMGAVQHQLSLDAISELFGSLA